VARKGSRYVDTSCRSEGSEPISNYCWRLEDTAFSRYWLGGHCVTAVTSVLLLRGETASRRVTNEAWNAQPSEMLHFMSSNKRKKLQNRLNLGLWLKKYWHTYGKIKMLRSMSVLVTVMMVTVLYLLSTDCTTPSESKYIDLYLPKYDSQMYQVQSPGYRMIGRKIVVRFAAGVSFPSLTFFPDRRRDKSSVMYKKLQGVKWQVSEQTIQFQNFFYVGLWIFTHIWFSKRKKIIDLHLSYFTSKQQKQQKNKDIKIIRIYVMYSKL